MLHRHVLLDTLAVFDIFVKFEDLMERRLKVGMGVDESLEASEEFGVGFVECEGVEDV